MARGAATRKAARPPRDLPTRIGRLLDTGLSMEGLAEKVGCSLATLYRWRAGEGTPHRSMVRMFGMVEAALSGNGTSRGMMAS